MTNSGRAIRVGFYNGQPEITVRGHYYYNDYDKGVINIFTYVEGQRRIVATFSLQHNFIIIDDADAQ